MAGLRVSFTATTDCFPFEAPFAGAVAVSASNSTRSYLPVFQNRARISFEFVATHEFIHRKTHAFGVISRKDITEVTCRDDILDLRPGGDRLDAEVREEVVHRLSEDSGPVDGVYRSQAVFVVEFLISEESFDDVLPLGSARPGKAISGSKHTWQSSNVPLTAILWTFASVIVVIWAC
jgi:hypothetical protein